MSLSLCCPDSWPGPGPALQSPPSSDLIQNQLMTCYCVLPAIMSWGVRHTLPSAENWKKYVVRLEKYLSFWIGTSPELHVFLSSCNSLDRVMCNVECVTYYQFLIWNRWPIETLRLPPLIMLLLRITAVSGDNAEEKQSLELEFCVWEVSTTHPDQ